jgi:hypothetical protein
VKDQDDLAGGPVVSRKSGDLRIGRDFATRDRLDRFLRSGLELHRFLDLGNGYSFSATRLFLEKEYQGMSRESNERGISKIL